MGETKTDERGAFTLDVHRATEGSVFYLVAKEPKPGVALLSVLGTSVPNTVTVNELTTVASAFTCARFIIGEAISAKRSDCTSPPGTHRTLWTL